MSQITVEARWNTGQTETNDEGIEINVTNKASVDFDFGENIEDAIAQFGADPVFALYLSQAKVQLQGAIRVQGELGVAADEIESRLTTWKPGVRMGRATVDPVVALKAQYEVADEEGKAKLLAQIMGDG